MPSFFQANRALLATLLGILVLMVAASSLSKNISYPVLPTRFQIATTPQSNKQFWIGSWEPYQGKLWVGQPAELDRKTFDLVTGCLDTSATPAREPTPEWTIKSVGDQRVVVQKKAVLINPPADECSSTGGGHVFSLGEFAIAPGRYQFELKFSTEIPESMSFPVELDIHCCTGRWAYTKLGSFPIFLFYLLGPILILIFSLLLLIFFIRAGSLRIVQTG